jgi:sRNA-binding protein
MHPLKIGIDHDLRERLEAPKPVLHYCMQRYTGKPAYLRALIAQKPRLDLTGQAVGTVTDEDRESAQVRLSGRDDRRRPYHLRERGLVQQIKRGLYEAAEKAEQEGET